MLGSKAGVEATNAASQYSHFPPLGEQEGWTSLASEDRCLV